MKSYCESYHYRSCHHYKNYANCHYNRCYSYYHSMKSYGSSMRKRTKNCDY